MLVPCHEYVRDIAIRCIYCYEKSSVLLATLRVQMHNTHIHTPHTGVKRRWQD